MLQQSIVIHILKSITTFKLCHVIKTLIITLQTSLLIPIKLLKYCSYKATKHVRNKGQELLIKQSNLQMPMFKKVLYQMPMFKKVLY